jgi:pimeloyl-ACP methyl ester carboxylesterase
MTTQQIENNQPLAVCLHASASSSKQWQSLAGLLEGHVRTVMPDMVGYGTARPYRSRKRFTIREEVDNILDQVRVQTGKDNGPLHLVGHSYGGATALQIALMYPERVASITVYEPAQFLMLFQDGLASAEATEILDVWRRARRLSRSIFTRSAAAKLFIEYWSGEGVWQHIPRARQRKFARLMPKVIAEFEALLSAGVSVDDFKKLNIPVRLICGTKTRATTSKVFRILADSLPNVEVIEVEGAAHMAPTQTPDTIDPLFAEHVIAMLQEKLRIAA